MKNLKNRMKNFIHGASTILEIYPPKRKNFITKSTDNVQEKDFNALYSDWERVGDTMSKIIDHECIKNGC